ncbi:MAG: YhcH/YjgK/YiaL family protein [Salinivirgaceae bacterium]|nr:YhcH/YjgK/YiaL family protein [Salinivirgaceae bacterium]
MIKDSLTNHAKYDSLHPLFAKAFEYLSSADLADYDEGKYPIDGNDMYASVSEYVTKSEGQLEGHIEYIDIQYIIKGSEIIGYAPKGSQKESIPYSNEHDIAFYEGDYEPVTLNAGEFVILYPDDLHLPCLKNGKPSVVKKVVVKVRLTPSKSAK